ncbi:MAG: hypothetical protein RL088_4074 [Verrucomicrobiota bacterium]|jgi:hypothetical protein
MIARAGEDAPGAPGCLPNASQKMLLRAACNPEGDGQAAWQRWRASHEIVHADPAARRLLPWIYLQRELLKLSGEDCVETGQIYRFVWFRNQRLLNAAEQAVAALRKEGMEPFLLKGVPLLLEAYQDEGGRYLSDFDLLIRAVEIQPAVAALARLKWKAQVPEVFCRRVFNLRHSEEFVDGSGLSCDLHWRLFRARHAPVPLEWIDDDARTLSFRCGAVRVPSVEHSLLLLCVHGMSWENVPPIRWILDFCLLLRRHAVDWDHFIQEAERFAVALPVSEALATFHEIEPEAVPDYVRERLARTRTHESRRVAYQKMVQPYASASLRMKWRWINEERQLAVALGQVPPGVRGLLRHLCGKLGAKSVWQLPASIGRRLMAQSGPHS